MGAAKGAAQAAAVSAARPKRKAAQGEAVAIRPLPLFATDAQSVVASVFALCVAFVRVWY